MSELGKCILVINSDRATGKWGNSVNHVFMMDTHEEALKKARDLIHTEHKFPAHPQASSLKPNQTPYRTILLHGVQGSDETEGVCLTEDAPKTYKKWNSIRKIPEYDEKTAYGYKTINLPMIENAIPRLQGADCGG